MDKLLHERLRESKKGQSWIGVRPYDDEFILWRSDAERLADEIERCYIPRPRFEDGEPVQFGDEVEGCDGLTECLLLFEDGSGTIYGVNDDVWGDNSANIGADISGIDRFVVKRPAKVLDADGVEIKAGQEVYGTGREQHRYIVLMPHDECNGAIFTVKCRDLDDEGVVCHCAPSQLTHEKPVFDAEGVRICKGDTVWLKNGSKPYEVISTEHGWIVANDEDGIKSNFPHPDMLTHREPDSLEKLRDAMKGSMSSEVRIYADRLTAIIERGE